MKNEKFHTDLEYGKKGREKLKKGADKVAEAVKISLGPSGKNCCIKLGDKYAVRVSKDGFTIAQSIMLEDPVENIGCLTMKQAAMNTVAQAGDGTSSATLLAQEIMHQGFNAVDNKANATELRKGMNKAVEDVVAHIKKISKPVNGDQSKINAVATISANNDPVLGGVIADAFEKTGEDGVLSVEKNMKNLDTYAEITEGFKVEAGINCQEFINNEKNNTQEFKDPYILITDLRFEDVNSMFYVLGFMSFVKKFNPDLYRPLVFVCDDITDEALKTLIKNKKNNELPSFGMCNAPAFAIERQLRLEDMAITLGGTYFSDEKEYDLNVFKKAADSIIALDQDNERVSKATQYQQIQRDKIIADNYQNILNIISETITYLGKCARIESNMYSTLIVGGEGNSEEIEARAEGLRKQIEDTKGETDKQSLKNRLAKLTCGIGVIKVGASTEAEYQEKCDLIDDSIRATKSATEEGIVSGGGIALLRISDKMKDSKKKFENQDQHLGYSIILSAIRKPFSQILENAGKTTEEIKEITEKVLAGEGYNAKTEKYCKSMIKEGIIDPAKVTRVALESAVSMASTLLTTEVVIVGDLNE